MSTTSLSSKASPRKLANREVGLAAYANAVQTLFDATPKVDLLVRLGPILVKSDRNVTPQMLMSVRPFLKYMIEAGCSNGAMQPMKLNSALQIVLTKNKAYMRSWTRKGDAAPTVCAHLMQCMHALRNLAWENHRPGSKERTYRRSGGLRKKMSGEERVELQRLMDLMDFGDEHEEQVGGAQEGGIQKGVLWHNRELSCNRRLTTFGGVLC